MRGLKRQIWYDIQAGTFSIWHDYFICIVLLIFITESMYHGMIWLDCISGYFRGIMEASIRKGAQVFRIPIEWFLFHIGYLFFVVRYPLRDYSERGYQFLIRSRRKKIWWISKYIWTIGTAVGYCLMFYAVTFLWSFGLGRGIIWKQSDRWGLNLGEYSLDKIVWLLFVMPMVVSAAFSTFVLMVTFVWNQTGAVVSMLTILMASAYWKHPFLIGNYTMLCRYDLAGEMMKEQILCGCVICVGIMMVCGLAGYICFCRKQVMGF